MNIEEFKIEINEFEKFIKEHFPEIKTFTMYYSAKREGLTAYYRKEIIDANNHKIDTKEIKIFREPRWKCFVIQKKEYLTLPEYKSEVG